MNAPHTLRRRAMSLVGVLGVAALAVTACSSGTPTPAPDNGGATGGAGDPAPVTLTFLSAFPETSPNNDGFWMFQEKLEEIAPWITIEYRGGPEVVDPFVMIESVQSGAVDGATLPGDYYVGQMPLMEITRFTPFTPTQERENGVFELYGEAHESLGLHYVGHSNAGMPQVILLKDEVSAPDFSGKTIRVSAATSNMVLALGGNPVSMPGTEIFTALQTGTIDGTGWNSTGAVALGFYTEVDYEIAPRFYDSIQNVVINQAKWDSLDEATQAAITEAMAATEPEIFDHYNGLARDEVKQWREAGIERIEFDKAGTDKMLKIAYVDAWDALDWSKIVSSSPQAEDIRKAFEAAYDLNDLSKAVPGGIIIEPSN